MKIDPDESFANRHAHLTAAAERIYGPERAGQLASQLEHLARMMSDVAKLELELTDEPLPGPVDLNRGSR